MAGFQGKNEWAGEPGRRPRRERYTFAGQSSISVICEGCLPALLFWSHPAYEQQLSGRCTPATPPPRLSQSIPVAARHTEATGEPACLPHPCSHGITAASLAAPVSHS